MMYLRRIHFLCYYGGKHFLSEEHMFARCSGMHARTVSADVSLAISGNIDIDEANRNAAKCLDFDAQSDCESKPRWDCV